MNTIKMNKKTPVSFGDNTLQISLPDSWAKLSQNQLRYVCFLMTKFDLATAKTYLFIRLSGIRVIRKKEDGWVCSVKLDKTVYFTLTQWQVAYFIKVFDFIDTPPDYPVNLHEIDKYHAVNSLLHGITFKEYITIENLYQGYLQVGNFDHLRKIAQRLYVDKLGNNPPLTLFTECELLSVFLWFASLKKHFTKCFPDFFKSAGGSADPPDLIDIMNAEIRALTGGDVTKENEVLNIECWRALTELNEKAREAKEIKRMYGRK